MGVCSDTAKKRVHVSRSLTLLDACTSHLLTQHCFLVHCVSCLQYDVLLPLIGLC